MSLIGDMKVYFVVFMIFFGLYYIVRLFYKGNENIFTYIWIISIINVFFGLFDFLTRTGDFLPLASLTGENATDRIASFFMLFSFFPHSYFLEKKLLKNDKKVAIEKAKIVKKRQDERKIKAAEDAAQKAGQKILDEKKKAANLYIKK